MKKVLMLLSISALTLAGLGLAAQTSSGRSYDIATIKPLDLRAQQQMSEELMRFKSGSLAKIGHDLGTLAEDYSAFKSATSLNAKEPFQSPNPVIRVVDGERVVIDAVATDNPQRLLEELRSMGLVNGAVFGKMVSGELPVSAIMEMSKSESLAFARPAAYKSNAGLVTSRGATVIRADSLTSTYGIDGSGVVIGTLSDSFDCSGGAAAEVANDDLPAGITLLADACPNTDEGRAMMQIIHDVAPGSSQAFRTSNRGQADFALGILELAAVAGADVIVDDTIYFAEPMFQDGIIAQAVDIVKNAGVAYFSSAGNDGRHSYESPFRPSSSIGVFGGIRHDFDPGPGVDPFQTITLGTGLTIFSFQWSNPFFSVSGAPGATSDIDMLIYTLGGTFIGLGGFTVNIGGDAVELFGINNSGPPAQVQIGLELFTGPPPALIKYVFFDPGGTSIDQFNTNSSTIYGHTNAAGCESVGAAVWYNAPAFNTFLTIPVVNTTSAIGPTPILFDTSGNPISEIRAKPEIVGPDGVNTTFFGFDLPFTIPGTSEPDGFPNFFGTSASAPHAAAAAALLLQIDGSLSPDDIYSLLETTAIDMDDRGIAGFQAGFDFNTGFGMVDIFAAGQAAARSGKKFKVCHIPPGNPGNAHTITIPAAALGAHLAHGDKFGPCN